MTAHGAPWRRQAQSCISSDKTTAHGSPRRTYLTETWQIGGYSIGKCAVVSTCAVVHYRKKSTSQPTTPISSKMTIAVTSNQITKRKPVGTLDVGVLSLGSELARRRSSAWVKAVSTKPTAAITNKKLSTSSPARTRASGWSAQCCQASHSEQRNTDRKTSFGRWSSKPPTRLQSLRALSFRALQLVG